MKKGSWQKTKLPLIILAFKESNLYRLLEIPSAKPLNSARSRNLPIPE
jgi:hypothetical protein